MSELDRHLDEALIWDYFLRTYHRTPDEIKEQTPWWMPECLLIIGAARADAEREARDREAA